MEHVIICHLGRTAYEPAWALQKQLQARLIADKRSTAPVGLPHVMLLVEHPPVYTLGKSGDVAHLLASEATLKARGATFHRIDRGGDITYHGPGQLVGYPLLDLDRFFTDIHRYLRTLEEVIIQTCADYDVQGRRVEGRTGVWVGPDAHGPERKICAFGIRCSRWVTMHGFAFNLNTRLADFDAIVPCGIADRGVTSLAQELGHSIDEAAVRTRVHHHFASQFNAEVTPLAENDAQDFIEHVLHTPDTDLLPSAP